MTSAATRRRLLATIRIGAESWRVFLVSFEALAKETGSEDRGVCWTSCQEIWLAPCKTLDAALDVYTHELIHAFISVWGFDGMSDAREERLVLRLTGAALCTLQGAEMLKVPAWLKKVVKRGL